MNELKISNVHTNIFTIIAAFLLLIAVCSGLLYYYRGTDRQLESELTSIERLNSELASETRKLQAGIASHSAGIRAIGGSISKSRKRIERVYTNLKEAGTDTERAIGLIEECENIIEKVKTQR